MKLFCSCTLWPHSPVMLPSAIRLTTMLFSFSKQWSLHFNPVRSFLKWQLCVYLGGPAGRVPKLYLLLLLYDTEWFVILCQSLNYLTWPTRWNIWLYLCKISRWNLGDAFCLARLFLFCVKTYSLLTNNITLVFRANPACAMKQVTNADFHMFQQEKEEKQRQEEKSSWWRRQTGCRWYVCLLSCLPSDKMVNIISLCTVDRSHNWYDHSCICFFIIIGGKWSWY